MQVIEIRHPYHQEQLPNEPMVLVLGFFDGVHKGHQKVIETGRKKADELGIKLAVMTFNQHPSIVFKKIAPHSMKYLTTVKQKANLMAQQGVDYLFVVDFTSGFASLSPQAFVDQYIVNWQAQVVVAGFDYTYGPKEIAAMEHLPLYAKERFEVITVPKKTLTGEKVSSTRIRQALAAGEMEEVNTMLGYEYVTEGLVVHGDARGRLLGFPTANIQTKSTVRLPKEGVYVTEILIGDTWYPSMGSIGRNDTFEKNRPITVEVNIFDFHEDIYGEHVEVRWLAYLRDQEAYPSVDALVTQLQLDEKNSRAYFTDK